MLRGFYTAASGMITQQRQQEALSNNMTNAHTPGYKADQPVKRAFPEMLMNKLGTKKLPTTDETNLPVKQPIGPLHTGVYVHEMVPNFTQGDVRETGVSTDLAIVEEDVPDETGGLFFTVQNEDGDIRYTRNGNFTVDGEGMLVTNNGYYVLDDQGNPIATDGLEFTVHSDATLEVGDANIPLGISYVADVNELEKEGNDLLTGDAEADIPADASYSIKQGFLEQSNVDSLQTMTEMMESYRMFETNQRVLRAYDESMNKAVNDIARLA